MEFNNTTINSTYSEIGGLVYFLVYISDYLPYVILVSLGTIIGVTGNLLIMATIIVNKNLHSPTYMMIFNLSLADISISGFVDIFTTLGVFLGKSFFDQRPALCQLIAAVCLIACITSLVNMGFLSINRYIHICHYSLYKKMFNKWQTFLYCVITWVIGVLIDLPNYTGWGRHSYDTATLSCLWDRLASQSYSIFFPMSSIVVPCIAILFCYVKIFIHSSRSKTRSHSTNQNHSLRLAQGLFVSFVLFTVCWLPYGVIVMADYSDRLPRSAVMFTMTFAHLNSSLNPILYGIYNPAFRAGYMVLFRKITCRSITIDRVSPIRKETIRETLRREAY